MRFFTIVAFMLPLSALAAPTPTSQPSSDDLAAQVIAARDKFSTAFVNTSLALNNTINQLSESASTSKFSHALLDLADKANENLAIVFNAGQRIEADIAAGKAPQESDQLDVAKGTIKAQEIINCLDKKVNEHKGKGKGKVDLEQLRSNVRDALDGINKTVEAGEEVLELQGKSVRQLFENAGLKVPPGF